MKAVVVIALSLCLATGSVLADRYEPGKHRSGKQSSAMVMRHANPMPNLMQAIKKHGDQLNLSGSQEAALSAWHKAHTDPMHARAAQIGDMEKALNEAALAGRPKAELLNMNARILTAREQIVAIKADCRDNMRKILSPEQFNKVLSIYADMQAGS